MNDEANGLQINKQILEPVLQKISNPHYLSDFVIKGERMKMFYQEMLSILTDLLKKVITGEYKQINESNHFPLSSKKISYVEVSSSSEQFENIKSLLANTIRLSSPINIILHSQNKHIVPDVVIESKVSHIFTLLLSKAFADKNMHIICQARISTGNGDIKNFQVVFGLSS